MLITSVLRSSVGTSCFKKCTSRMPLSPLSPYFVAFERKTCINIKPCRGKKTFNFPTPPPINFRSGDTAPYRPPPKDEILYKYRHIGGIDEFHPDLKKLFTVHHASEKEVLEHQHMQVQDLLCEKTGPGLNYEKLIAYLTIKIRQMMSACQNNRQNKRLKHQTFNRIAKRHKFINYLRRQHNESFQWLMKELKIDFKQPTRQELKRRTRKEIRFQEAKDKMKMDKEQKKTDLEKMFKVEKEKFLDYKKAVLEEITKDAENHNINVSEILQNFKEEQDKRSQAIQAKPVKMGRLFVDFYKEEKIRKEQQLKIIPNPYVLGTKK